VTNTNNNNVYINQNLLLHAKYITRWPAPKTQWKTCMWAQCLREDEQLLCSRMEHGILYRDNNILKTVANFNSK